jgi:hypothetical protein
MRDRFLEEIRMGQSRRGAAETLGIPRTTINNLIGKDPKFTAAEAEKARSDGKFGRTGRPVGAVSAFTEPVRKKFLEAVRMGMSITRAADLCRIDKQSVRRYRKADPVFRQDLLAAYAECEMYHLKEWAQGKGKDWTRHAEFVSRRFPRDWARRALVGQEPKEREEVRIIRMRPIRQSPPPVPQVQEDAPPVVAVVTHADVRTQSA